MSRILHKPFHEILWCGSRTWDSILRCGSRTWESVASPPLEQQDGHARPSASGSALAPPVNV
eukprot:9611352-Karenia_brevis.AAC.1